MHSNGTQTLHPVSPSFGEVNQMSNGTREGMCEAREFYRMEFDLTHLVGVGQSSQTHSRVADYRFR